MYFFCLRFDLVVLMEGYHNIQLIEENTARIEIKIFVLTGFKRGIEEGEAIARDSPSYKFVIC